MLQSFFSLSNEEVFTFLPAVSQLQLQSSSVHRPTRIKGSLLPVLPSLEHSLAYLSYRHSHSLPRLSHELPLYFRCFHLFGHHRPCPSAVRAIFICLWIPRWVTLWIFLWFRFAPRWTRLGIREFPSIIWPQRVRSSSRIWTLRISLITLRQSIRRLVLWTIVRGFTVHDFLFLAHLLLCISQSATQFQ